MICSLTVKLKHGILLRYKGKKKIKIPAYIAHFDQIKDYCFYRLEQIGTFEDGRKVRRDKYAEISWTVSGAHLSF